MRAHYLFITATVALIVAGCGDQAREDRDTYYTPASYETLASDRTRGRDEAPRVTGQPQGDVQGAYDRTRADDRARGELGTAGEAARAGQPTDGTFGGTSAGSEAAPAPIPARPETDAPAGEPIPYGGSRRIDAPYPGLPSDGGDRQKPAQPERLETAPPAEQRYMGLPPPNSTGTAAGSRPGY
ncbi:MAG TPA: hypothetical protein VEL07_22225 [Planctomycetota bacterium]|nr:hypothetical protein [Planctomycetota bacterium]